MDNLKNHNIKLIIVITIITTFLISSTYAFLEFTKTENIVGTKTGCFDVNYSAQVINATNLVSTTNYTQGATSQVTLSKDEGCQIYNEASIYIHTNTTETTAPINTVKALKYKVLNPSNTIISEGTITTTNGEDLQIATVPLTTTATTYTIYIWIDSSISLGYYNSTAYSGYIYASSIQSSTIGGTTYLSNYVINKYNDGSTITTVNIGGSTSNPQVHLNATQGIMLDNNGDYRYYGADPNNYVWYNDELWRIISVGNVKSSATDTVGETRVKIVKADILKDDNNLSAYSWDSSASTVNSGYGVNDWSKSDLMTELNSLYLNSTSGTCYTGSSNASTACNFTNTGLSAEAKSLTADALYYLGGSSTYSGLYADDYYTFERGTTVYNCSANDGACPRATTWTGRVGIIYPSDYAYATDLSVCTNGAYNYDTDTNCKSKDWLLYSGNLQWTISPYSGYAYIAFDVHSDGYVARGNVGGALAVRPVQYLRSDAAIVSGEGTDELPYILG